MERRVLSFANLDEVAADLDALLGKGYQSLGNWNLGQVCGHLNEWMRFPMDGFPKPGCPMNAILWSMRVTVGKRMLQQTLDQGFTAGRPTMPQTVPTPDAETDEAAVTALKQSMQRFQNYAGPIHRSPLFGELDRDTTLKIQLRHCEHHLSFLVPRPGS